MTQEADFCGDRLRLSAFLRVVADGMPQRPTRFKRRSRGIDHRLGSSGQHDTDHVDARSSPAQKAAHEQCHNNTSILDVVRSPSPQLPELAAEDFRSVTRAKSGSQKDREQSEDVQPSENQRQTGERTSVTAVTKSLKKPRKIPSTRKRRHLPVNGLALLRSTSSDGLPLPSVRYCPARQVQLAIADTNAFRMPITSLPLLWPLLILSTIARYDQSHLPKSCLDDLGATVSRSRHWRQVANLAHQRGYCVGDSFIFLWQGPTGHTAARLQDTVLL